MSGRFDGQVAIVTGAARGIGLGIAARLGFTRALAKELADSGILVNCIVPVITETDRFKEMTADHIATMKAKIPMGRFLKVDEIAAMVAWIASPECSFSTGATFGLSGGRAPY